MAESHTYIEIPGMSCGDGTGGVYLEGDDVIHVELWYPSVEGARSTIRIGLSDTHSVDDIVVKYDREDGGWVIYRVDEDKAGNYVGLSEEAFIHGFSA